MTDAAKLLRRLADLQQQAGYAEARSGVKLRDARYTSSRELLRERSGVVQTFTVFAVSVPDAAGGKGLKDILLARTPELAKTVALLLSLGDELVPLLQSILQSLPREGSDG